MAMKVLRKNIGLAIRNARIASEMNQATLAQHLDVSKQMISKWERGDESVPHARIKQIEVTLNERIDVQDPEEFSDSQQELVLRLAKEIGYKRARKLLGEDHYDSNHVLTTSLIADSLLLERIRKKLVHILSSIEEVKKTKLYIGEDPRASRNAIEAIEIELERFIGQLLQERISTLRLVDSIRSADDPELPRVSIPSPF